MNFKTIFFNGRTVKAHENDTVASALYRAGARIFSRSFKYHRPRGLLCLAGRCPNCLMNVDGIPNIRSCTTPVHDGMQVKHQNAYPSLEHDWLSVAEWFSWLMPVGFYYKTFTHPKVWRFVEPLIRKVAGLGEIPTQGKWKMENGKWKTININHESQSILHSPFSIFPEYEHIHLHTDAAIIGGGPAGIIAAINAAKVGDQVTLIDDQSELGGHLRYQMGKIENGKWKMEDDPDLSRFRGFEIAQKLAEYIVGSHDRAPLPNVHVLKNASCFGLYEGNLLGIVHKNFSNPQSTIRNPPSTVRERLIHLRAKRIIVATGAYEVPIVFENNDLPGVMLSSAVQRLVNMHGIKPAESAVIVSQEQDGGQVAEDLRHSGVRIVAVVPPDAVVCATGRRHVTGIRTTEKHLACDLIVVCGGWVPDAALITQAGGKLEWDEERKAFVPRQLPSHLTTVGDVTGASFEENGKWKMENGEKQRQDRSFNPFSILHSPFSNHNKSLVCLCEDVTVKDLCHAIAEGFDHIETLKRYTTVTMGPCQGKMCQLASIGICAHQTNRTMDQTGTTTSRPPMSSVSLGSLAGASHHPVKRTPMHYKHEEFDAVWMDMGEWKRPQYYEDGGRRAEGGKDREGEWENGRMGERKRKRIFFSHSPTHPFSHSIFNAALCPPPSALEREYRAVRERVGIIDLSTLGKLEVKGKDAAKLLNKVYTNQLSDLRAGRVRYSVICDDSGIILDDGTISRLANDHFFITTTTGNLDFVQQWLEWWAVGTGWCVHVTNLTGGLAAVNVAGPKAREVLKNLTDGDLSSKAFPYMACREVEVGGVPCLMLRIGFVGETGWEIHFPAESGEYLWELIMESGRDKGIQAFGVETQRILRLEKKHIIVGVDTDATSNPIESDLAWVAKLDKEDFIGKAAILRVQAREMREKLIGFVMQDTVVPDDGAAVIHNGKPVGRVTSVRFSPVNGKAVGLAWLPADLASDGQEIQIHVNGQMAKARIVSNPFYDPEGKRLRI